MLRDAHTSGGNNSGGARLGACHEVNQRSLPPAVCPPACCCALYLEAPPVAMRLRVGAHISRRARYIVEVQRMEIHTAPAKELGV